MYQSNDSSTNTGASRLQVFFSTAGQGPTQDYAWQSETEMPVPGILDEISEKYIDNREISWVVRRTGTDELMLIVRQLPSRITDPGLRRHKNAFAVRMPGSEEGWMRAIMIELLHNYDRLARQVDELVSIDSGNARYGWNFRFDEFRTLLNLIREQVEISFAENDAEPCSYRFSSPDSRRQFSDKLLATCLPKDEWIAICNPIVTDAVLEMPVWALVTDSPVGVKRNVRTKGESGNDDAVFSNISRDEVAIAVIAAAALIVVWLLVRRK